MIASSFFQWWDVAGVRLMWLKESILNFLDNALTRIDSFLLKVQDLVIAVISFFLRPIAYIYRYFGLPSNVSSSLQVTQSEVELFFSVSSLCE